MRTLPTDHDAARTPLSRFFDSFLQEKNIQWVLGAGMLIVLGSTLMFVVSHWNDYTPAWKYLIMLAYTAGIYGSGRWSYRDFALRKTGTVLMSLTVLLIPVLFMALHWVHRPGFASEWLGALDGHGAAARLAESSWENSPNQLISVVLWAGTLAFATHAARRIFGHFLRKPQPTFLVCYLILCAAGALGPAIPAALAPWAALALWSVFTIGVIKINRHVFWLTEEHSAPRVLGFLPTALLSLQFLVVFAINFARHVSVEWLGFGSVLVAVPMLLTANEVARVFQQRTGDLVRPLPWSIMAPTLVGLTLCAIGLSLAATGMTGSGSPYALVPTCALIAAMMYAVAQRTGKQVFVWFMLAATTIAYNFSPVFFQELAARAIRSGAVALHEQRLPYAFYGLTYLPMLAVATILGTVTRRTGNRLFGPALGTFSVALGCLLLAASVTHMKAMLPVATVMSVMFGIQLVLYRNPSLVIPAVAAVLVAACGLVPFGNSVLQLSLPDVAWLNSLLGASVLLLVPGHAIDRWLKSLSSDSPACAGARTTLDWSRTQFCQIVSLCITLVAAGCWVVHYSDANLLFLTPVDTAGFVAAALATVLLLVHGVRWVRPALSAVAIVFGYFAGATIAMRSDIATGTLVSEMVCVLLVQWLFGYVVRRNSETRLARGLGGSVHLIAAAGLCAAAFSFIPFAAADMLCVRTNSAITPWWICRLLVLVWTLDAARRYQSAGFAALGCITALTGSGAALIDAVGSDGWRWLPTLWVTMAACCLPVIELLRRRVDRIRQLDGETNYAGSAALLVSTVDAIVLGVLGVTSIASLGLLSLAMRVAGLIALGSLLWVAGSRRKPNLRLLSLMLVNWQIIVLGIALTAAQRMETIVDSVSTSTSWLPAAFAASVSLLVWQRLRRLRHGATAELAGVHCAALRVTSFAGLIASLLLNAVSPIDLGLALLAFAILIGSECISACTEQSESRVWNAEATIAAATGYFAWHGVIHFGHGISMYVVILCAFVAWSLSRFTQAHPAVSIMARPLERTALVLPAAAVIIGIYRHATVHPSWLGMNSLALLLAAGVYFWHGIARNQVRSLIASLAVLNVALILLWRELSWSDPQFYMIPIGLSILGMVRLLRDEIPVAAHTPLNYLGALVILVSPTFHIVTGSWLHLFALMFLSACVVLSAIGFRVRAPMYTGIAFLIADIVAMVIRGSIDDPNRLWIAGVVLGAAVVALGAVAERNRESLLQRLRVMSATLQTWS